MEQLKKISQELEKIINLKIFLNSEKSKIENLINIINSKLQEQNIKIVEVEVSELRNRQT
jgi:ABC-type uncharacterized transport system substrate-binding protein